MKIKVGVQYTTTRDGCNRPPLSARLFLLSQRYGRRIVHVRQSVVGYRYARCLLRTVSRYRLRRVSADLGLPYAVYKCGKRVCVSRFFFAVFFCFVILIFIATEFVVFVIVVTRKRRHGRHYHGIIFFMYSQP